MTLFNNPKSDRPDGTTGTTREKKLDISNNTSPLIPAAVQRDHLLAGTEPAWLDAYPIEHHNVLRRHGVDPSAHPDADACNRRIIADAISGLTGDELARRADEHQRAYVCEEEPPEIEPPDDLDWSIEIERGR